MPTKDTLTDLLKNYDRNEDGYLNKSEIKEMRRPPRQADTNGDGRVSRQELIKSVRKSAGGQQEKSGTETDASHKYAQGLGGQPAKTNPKTPIDVRINLFQFEAGNKLSMAKQLMNELEDADDKAEFLDSIADLDEVIITDELFFELPEGRLLKFGSNSESGRDLFSVQASLIDAHPQIKCNLEIRKTISGQRAQANSQEAKMQKN